ncbi:MAG TPA: aminotransferase class V-fold PLP-dependent enzyme [Gemmatimonadaceae bacterium]|nr:aminotransferase class V-fold PLP-dependent enzyme [Gemmatimonadaceae bacterium]
MTDPLLRFRAQFPILESANYLVSNSLGAMPRSVPARLAEYAEEWATRGVRAWAQGWWSMPVRVGDEIAPLIGAGPGEVAMVPNVSLAQAEVFSALDYGQGRDTIVMTELDFPSVRYVYDELATRLGARVVVVPSEDGVRVDEERLMAAIDERTRLVAISHVLFRSAYVMDVARVAAHAHAMGALVSLDAYHSVGVLPVDVHALGADFLTGGVLKWLCGGPGGCFLWVRPEVSASVTPALTGWQAHRQPFAFEPEMSYADGAWRWLGGTPVIPALFAATAGPRMLREAGMDAVRAKSLRQTARLIELADARGFPLTVAREPGRRGGTVAFDVPHAREVAQALLAADIIVDYRPGAGIRIAPHFYTSDEELEAAVQAIDDILATGAWKRYTGETLAVT